MPMLHIKPIIETNASEKVIPVFQDIKKTLNSEVVPLFFRYLANYEEYLVYVWEKIKINLISESFDERVKTIHESSLEAVEEIYTPSREMVRFFAEVPSAEKEELKNTISKLLILNMQLLIITIAMREGVKGVHIRQELLTSYVTSKHDEEMIFEETGLQKQQEKEVIAGSKMLAPLFGSSSLMVIHYPDFFSRIATEMGNLIKTEEYLKKRVALEHAGLKAIEGLAPLGCSYSEIAHFAAGKPYFNELLYILAETFPSQFPRLVVTSEVMWSLFLPKKNTIVPFA